MKRQDTISWDTYFMGLAHLSALRSKDPSTQVGAAIVNDNKKIVGIGYNGFPQGLDDDLYPWSREGSFQDTKYAYVVHAELNAILNATQNLQACAIYVSLFPCNECAKAIVQAGIKTVVYEDDKYADTDSVIVSKRILQGAGITLRQLKTPIRLSLEGVQ